MDFRNVLLAIVLSTKVLIGWGTFFEPPQVKKQIENKFQKIETLCVMASSAGFLSLSWVLNVYSYMYFVNFLYLFILSFITWFAAYILFKKGYKIKS